MNRDIKDGRSPWKLPLLGALWVLIAFLPTLKNGPVWDDHHLVLDNPYFQSFEGILGLFQSDIWTTTKLGVRSEYYRPLPMLSFAADQLIGGGSVAVFHLGNALIHALSAFALALVIQRGLGGRSRAIPVVFALAWGLSPVNTEPVAWISGRFDLLATLFILLALLANFGDSKKRQALTVLGVAASLLCKEAAILGPIFLALCDLLLLGRRPRALVIKYAALALVIVGNMSLRSLVGVITVAARPELLELSLSYAFMLKSVIGLTLFPKGLDAFHPYHAPSIAQAALVLGAAFIVSLTLCIASFRARNSRRYRFALFGWLWFCLMLAPASLTGPALDMVGDRYAYLPTLGLTFMLAALSLELRDRLYAIWPPKRMAMAGAVVAIFTLAASTVRAVHRIGDWRDDSSLIHASLRAHPGNPYAIYALGERKVLAGEYEEGDELLRRSIETGPRPWRALNALCYSLLNQSRLEEAESFCVRSLAINGQDPRTWVNLASIRVRQKRWEEALHFAKLARRYQHRYAEAHYLAAVSLANLGQTEAAIVELRQALELEPEHKAARSLAKQFEKRGLSAL